MTPLPITVVLLVGAVIAAFAFHMHFAAGLLIGFALVNELFRAAANFSAAQANAGAPVRRDTGIPEYTDNS